jgi:hypothetical protein
MKCDKKETVKTFMTGFFPPSHMFELILGEREFVSYNH